MADEKPKPLGRGRGLLLRNIAQRRAADEAAETEAKKKEEEKKEETEGAAKAADPVEAQPPITGRGRGMAARLAARSVKKLGKVDEEETPSFKSEDFETSSRVGVADVDVKAVAKKLEVSLLSRDFFLVFFKKKYFKKFTVFRNWI